MFIWSAEPPQEWVRALRAISPPSPQLSHVELWWEAGFPWAPVQRWVLYELIPLRSLTAQAQLDWATLMEMEQPCRCAWTWTWGAICSRCMAPWPCECGAHTDAESIRCPHCKRVRSQGRTNLIAAFQRGYQSFPLWVLQGEHGGHKLRYTDAERVIAARLGMAPRPPEPGSLPYAPWDERVRANLLRYDLAQTRLASLRSARREQRAELAKEARRLTEAYLTGIFDRVRDETPRTFADDLPRVDDPRPREDDATIAARYIETGRLDPVT